MTPVETFTQYVKEQCEKNEITPVFPNERSVSYDGERHVNGYFCCNKKVLAVAMGQPEENWLKLLVHEFAHFLQWKYGDKEWTDANNHPLVKKHNIEDAYDTFVFWLEGEEYPDEIIDLCCGITRDLELGAERRAIELIKEFNLPIDIETYAKKASAYVHFYNVIRVSRLWYKIDKEPYNIPSILELMPTNLDGDYSKTPRKWVKEMFERCCL